MKRLVLLALLAGCATVPPPPCLCYCPPPVALRPNPFDPPLSASASALVLIEAEEAAGDAVVEADALGAATERADEERKMKEWDAEVQGNELQGRLDGAMKP